jgi:hypothetical protein
MESFLLPEAARVMQSRAFVCGGHDALAAVALAVEAQLPALIAAPREQVALRRHRQRVRRARRHARDLRNHIRQRPAPSRLPSAGVHILIHAAQGMVLPKEQAVLWMRALFLGGTVQSACKQVAKLMMKTMLTDMDGQRAASLLSRHRGPVARSFTLERVNLCMMACGVARSSRSPSPSCPCELSPQLYTSPDRLTANVCAAPAAAHTNLMPVMAPCTMIIRTPPYTSQPAITLP